MSTSPDKDYEMASKPPQRPPYPAYLGYLSETSNQTAKQQPIQDLLAFDHQQPFQVSSQPRYIPQLQTNWFGDAELQNYLLAASSFVVKQQLDPYSTLCGLEKPRHYTINDQAGNNILYVDEQSDSMARECLGSSRAFTLSVKDIKGRDVICYERTHDFDCGCCVCFSDTLRVITPSGQVLGTVLGKERIFNPRYDIKNSADRTVLKIQGPTWPVSCCKPVVFKLKTPDAVTVGAITREWSGLAKELRSEVDFFSISFPLDLDPSIKAVCLGALFLIHYHNF